jgi:hypothetical protein
MKRASSLLAAIAIAATGVVFSGCDDNGTTVTIQTTGTTSTSPSGTSGTETTDTGTTPSGEPGLNP